MKISIKSRYGLVTKPNGKKTHTLYFTITTPPNMMNHGGIGNYTVCLDLPGAVCTSRWKSWSIAQGTVVEFPSGKFASRQLVFEYSKQPRLLDCKARIRVSARKDGVEIAGAKQSLEWEVIKQNGRMVGLNMITGRTYNEASGILEGVKRNPPKRKPPVVKDNTPDDLPDGYLEAAKNTAWNIVNPFKNYLIKTLRPESFGEDIDHIPQLKKSVAQSFHNRVASIKKACGDEITFRQVMNEIRTQVRKKAGVYGNVEELQAEIKKKDLRIQELHTEKVELEKENDELKDNLKTTIENNEVLRKEKADLELGLKHQIKMQGGAYGPGPHEKGPPGIPTVDTIKTLLGSIERHLTSTELGRTEAWVLAQSKACLQSRTKPGFRTRYYLGKCIGTDDRIFDRLKKFWGLG